MPVEALDGVLFDLVPLRVGVMGGLFHLLLQLGLEPLLERRLVRRVQVVLAHPIIGNFGMVVPGHPVFEGRVVGGDHDGVPRIVLEGVAALTTVLDPGNARWDEWRLGRWVREARQHTAHVTDG